jgi:hypothetical protein
METLNRYIDGGSKRDPTTDLRGIENSDAAIRSRPVWKPRGRRTDCLYPPSPELPSLLNLRRDKTAG